MSSRTLLVLIGLLLSGCLGAGPAAPPASHPAADAERAQAVDATASVARADAIARGWSGDAVLRAIVGSEGAYAQPEDPPYAFDTRDDAAVGDGLALLWTYVYGAPGRASAFVVTVGADGAVVYQHEVGQEAARRLVPFSSPLHAGFVASRQAAAAVAENASSSAFVAEHPTSFVHMALFSSPDGDAWFVQRATATGFALAAVVDAASGRLASVSRFPDERPPCAGCRPTEPYAPPLPPDETASRSFTLNAFNPEARFDVFPQRPEFSFRLTISADVPGTSPVDDRTLTVYDPAGAVVGQRTGTGRLDVKLETNETFAGPYRAVVGSQVPPAQDQTIAFASRVTYTKFDPDAMRPLVAGGGSTSFGQTQDHPIHLPPDASATFRISFQTNAPAGVPPSPNASAWQVLDPQGKTVASGSAPSGSAAFATSAEGTYTLRVTGGTDAAFGEAYRFSFSAKMPTFAASPV